MANNHDCNDLLVGIDWILQVGFIQFYYVHADVVEIPPHGFCLLDDFANSFFILEPQHTNSFILVLY